MTARRRHRFHEAAHKLDPVARENGADLARKVAVRRSLNEAAHKLGYWAPPAVSAHEQESEATRRRFDALADSQRDVIAHAGRAVLVLGALGVVYGDIGTSPLYTEQVIFSSYRATAHITPAAVYGVASLIFWALMVVVSIKYAGFIMRAHNRGDGGIMALAALLQRNRVAHGALFVTLGIFGAALFFGDGVITPAISVLGSIQGVQVATPALAHLIVPLSVAILLGLFVLQRFGSGTIGSLFGPVILVWFTVIGVLGLTEVLKDPAVLQGLSPSWAVRFMIDHGAAGYLVLGGVVLAVTGAEALYADRGHFGASPIRMGWFGLALPALMLNYLGQAVFILHHPTLAKDANTFNPFYQMAPSWALWPLVILAAVATVIASQAAISGSFSVGKTGGAARFSPPAEGPAHLQDRRPDLRAGHQLGALHRRDRAHARVRLRHQAGGHLRRRGDRNVHPQHRAVPGRREVDLGHIQTKAGARRRAVPDRRDRVLQLEHRQSRARRLAALSGRGPAVDRDVELAPRPGDRH